MGVLNWLFGGAIPTAPVDINPATGLPMFGDIGGLDVGGSPYGVNLHQSSDWGTLDFGGVDTGLGSSGDWQC